MAVEDSWLVTAMVWTAGICSWTATLFSLAAIWSHCKNYSQPELQRWVVRIILMVPIYALTAWASLISVESAYYLDTLRDVYEAFVIYCFVSLLISYFGGERAFLLSMHDRNPTPLFWPASLIRKDLDLSDPYDYLFLKRGILQYVVVKPLLAGSTMLMRSFDVYHEGMWSFTDGYLWTQLVYNFSVSLSLYCLVVFYMATREPLAQWNPLPKFLCIKAIVFFSYWQGLGISILVGFGLIHDTPTLTADHIATFLQSWLICLEMIGGACGHWTSFSYLDYVPDSRIAGRVRLFYAIKDALGLKDVFIDAKNAWSGHQYTYKYFDPVVPYDELDLRLPLPARRRTSSQAAISESTDPESRTPPSSSGSTPSLRNEAVPATSSPGTAIKERRLRAGMRYTQGGKKTYWLPVDSAIDHRAVAFAAGGSSSHSSGGHLLHHGVHGGGSNIKAAAAFVGSNIHSASRLTHENRRVQRHYQSAAPAESGRAPSTPSTTVDASIHHHLQPITEQTQLLSFSASSASQFDELATVSMDISADQEAQDDDLYAEARTVEGDFNYPVVEIGVAFGYSRRRPYGNTIPRRGYNGRAPVNQDLFSDPSVVS